MSIKEYVHAPLSNLDYGFDWTAWLASGETISSSVWVASSGITLTSPQVVAGVVSTFASGGEVGKVYTLTNTITTSVGRVDSRALCLVCNVK